jgi:hypothetical protein
MPLRLLERCDVGKKLPHPPFRNGRLAAWISKLGDVAKPAVRCTPPHDRIVNGAVLTKDETRIPSVRGACQMCVAVDLAAIGAADAPRNARKICCRMSVAETVPVGGPPDGVAPPYPVASTIGPLRRMADRLDRWPSGSSTKAPLGAINSDAPATPDSREQRPHR